MGRAQLLLSLTVIIGACSGGSDLATPPESPPEDIPPTTFVLAVHGIGKGSGAVTTTDTTPLSCTIVEGVTSGSGCVAVYDSGSVVTLNAEPAENSEFSGWASAASGCTTASQCTLT